MNKPFKRIVIGILSAAGFEERRNHCRSTWVSDLKGHSDVEFAFITGGGSSDSLLQEFDVLRASCPDDYLTLPQKTKAMIQWALDHFEFEYFFKCDDDSYVSIPRLLRLDLLGREYVGAYCGGYAQGGAGYFLSRRASELVAQGLAEHPTGPEDLLVGRILKENGIPLSSDWRFRRSCSKWDRPRPDNLIITSHECRAREMHEIHEQIAGVAIADDPSNELFCVRAWATDYGMLGLGGALGFWVDGRHHICTSVKSIQHLDAGPFCECISAHANSTVVIEAKQPLSITGVLDKGAGDRSSSPIRFLCDGVRLGSLATPDFATPEIQIGIGKHTLEARCSAPQDIERAYSIWQIRARIPML